MTTLFHGSPSLFEKFDFNKIGENATDYGKGFYFTNNTVLANSYAGDEGYVYTVEFNGKKELSGSKKTLTKANIKKLVKEIQKQEDFLSNYGDVEYEGLNNVLVEAVNSIFDYNDSDVDMVSDMSNSIGSSELVLTAVYKLFGYDYVLECDKFETVGQCDVYVALTDKCFTIKEVNEVN